MRSEEDRTIQPPHPLIQSNCSSCLQAEAQRLFSQESLGSKSTLAARLFFFFLLLLILFSKTFENVTLSQLCWVEQDKESHVYT